MPVSEEYKKKHDLLLEYDIKKGVKLTSSKPSFVTEEEEIDDLPPTNDVEVDNNSIPEAPTEYENTEEVNKIKQEEEEKELAKEDDVTRIKKIQDLQTQAIESLERSVLDFEAQIEELKAQTADIEPLKDNLEIVREKVKAITPPTPEEALINAPKITGGISIEDYWKNYMNETDPTRKVVETEVDTVPLKQYSIPLDDLKYNNDLDIKKSFYQA